MTLAEILEWHWRRYPLLGAADVYKLIHQSVFGPGHIVASPAAALANLWAEIGRLEPGNAPETVDTEPLDPVGQFIRVNLLPLVGNSEKISQLGEALVQSSWVQGTALAMKERLTVAADWFAGVMPEIGQQLRQIARETEVAGFPPLHHTAVYIRAFQPAYRVVLAELWP